jgi:hypothetical protein
MCSHLHIYAERDFCAKPEYRNPDISVDRIWGGKFHRDYGWTFWEDLKEFCNETGFPLKDFVVDLRFNLLD